MGLKLFLFALLVVYSVQSINASSEYGLQSSNFAVDDNENGLEGLLKAVEYALNKILSVAGELVAELKQVLPKIGEKIAKLKDIIPNVLLIIGGLDEENLEHQCVKDKREQIGGETTKLIVNIISIVEPILEEVVKIVYSQIKIVATASKELLEKFYNCGNVLCQIRQMEAAKVLVKDAKDKVISLVLDNVDWENAMKLLKVPEQISELIGKSTTLVVEINKCIKAKL